MKANHIHQGRTAQIWRAAGMIWLIFVTLFFALLDLYFAKLQPFYTLFVAVLIVAISIALFIWSIKTLNLAKRLPEEKSLSNNSMKLWFIVVLVLEIVGLNIATFMLLKLNHFQYIVPVDILIVSLHFVPLARIFAMPIYYFLGIVMSLTAILTMVLVPVSSQIGNLITLAAIPSLLFIGLNWITIIYVLRDGMKYLITSAYPAK